MYDPLCGHERVNEDIRHVARKIRRKEEEESNEGAQEELPITRLMCAVEGVSTSRNDYLMNMDTDRHTLK